MFYDKKVFLEIFQNSQENTCAVISFLIKLQAEACNFIKKETLAQVFSCEFCKISKNIFFTEHLWTTVSVTPEKETECKGWKFKNTNFTRIAILIRYQKKKTVSFLVTMIFLSGRLSMKNVFLMTILTNRHDVFYYLPMLSLAAKCKMRVHYGKYFSSFSYLQLISRAFRSVK